MLFLICVTFGFIVCGANAQEDDKVVRTDTALDTTPLLIRVQEGGNASLPCTVHNLNKYKIMWFDTIGLLIYLSESRHTNDQRKYLTRPYLTDWNLHISDVQISDAGFYKCLVNTNPVQFRKIHLDILVAPQINQSTSSRNQRIPLGTHLFLQCHANGNPFPNITWLRRPHLKKENSSVFASDGEVFVANVTYSDSGVYTCVADNGVGSPAVHIIEVFVIDIRNRASSACRWRELCALMLFVIAAVLST